jgi:23S rRNA (cytidine2498-2'-O)-methyltransferase
VDSQTGEGGRARYFQELLLDFIRERFPRVHRRYRPAASIADETRDFLVLNLLLLGDGLRGAAMPAASLSDTHPGGIHRKAFDSAAPSRSYLKLEEAFDTMGCAPSKGSSVVDLGAAPGGWSYACLKRGCRVTAVDNGPLRIHEPGKHGGQLTHLRADGLTFKPNPQNVPVDWLVSDMLVTAGRDIGMLRPWFAGRWMCRFVVNIKLPQCHVYQALKPVEEYLATVPDISYSIRHLYHDRREVTLMGTVE